MSNLRWKFGRIAAVLAVAAMVPAVAPAANARVHVGFGVNIALPSNVHVSVGNYEPYYVGRVFYQPLSVWRPVYSFPVETPYGIEYAPYVYDGARVVCHDSIPGYEAGYGQFVVEGRGHYDPRWNHGSREYRAYDRYDGYRDRSHGRSVYWNQGRGHGRDDWYERSGSGSGRGGKHKQKHKHH